jgi:hypothetical protein
MALRGQGRQHTLPTAIPVERMRSLVVCRDPIAFETLEVYRNCHWQLPYVVVSAKEWIAERQRTAPGLLRYCLTTCIMSGNTTTPENGRLVAELLRVVTHARGARDASGAS